MTGSRRGPRALGVAAGILLLGCARPPRQPAPPARTAESLVMAALLDSIYRQLPDTLLVVDSTIGFRAPRGGRPAWRARFDSIPAELPPALEAVSRTRRPVVASSFPRPVHPMTRAELREIFASGSDGWKEFYRRYPSQRMYIAVSPIAFSSDSLNAIVYYTYGCGWLCGGSEAIWLARVDGAWRVRNVVVFTVS